MGAYKQSASVKNVRGDAIEVWFEPWGMNHLLPSGESFTLEIESEIEGQIVIEHSDDSIAVYAYPTSTIKVLLHGVLVDDLNVAFPLSALPANLTTKEFVQFLFGGPGQPRNSQLARRGITLRSTRAVDREDSAIEVIWPPTGYLGRCVLVPSETGVR